MTIRLSENIRAFRKARRLTQEQLAESLGVTVGAVSKWELGASTPDLSLIVEMAALFETSVDVLLGYEWHKGSVDESIQTMRALRNEKRFDEASAEAEKALQRYPNCFDLVYRAAILYDLRGIERREKKSSLRALELYNRALELIEQNTNPQISAWTIQNQIASVYLSLERTDEAVEQLRRYNAGGLNDGDIGFILATKKKSPDEALVHLSDALVVTSAALFRLIIGYINAYALKNQYGEALSAVRWGLGLIEGLKVPGEISYLDKECVILLAAGALMSANRQDEAGLRDFLTRAEAQAARFDASPSAGFVNTRFFHGDKNATGFDDLGASAHEALQTALKDGEDAPPAVKALLLRIQNELRVNG